MTIPRLFLLEVKTNKTESSADVVMQTTHFGQAYSAFCAQIACLNRPRTHTFSLSAWRGGRKESEYTEEESRLAEVEIKEIMGGKETLTPSGKDFYALLHVTHAFHALTQKKDRYRSGQRK